MHALHIVGLSKLYCNPMGVVTQYAIRNVKNVEVKYKQYIQIVNTHIYTYG